ncbi:MAG: pilus assembly protein PilM, partial [Candidatus Omnitrophota bacterium]
MFKLKLSKAKKKPIAGIDIGTNSVKILESTPKGEEISLTKYGAKRLPAEANDETVAQTVKMLVSEIGITAKDIHIGLSGPGAVVRFISMPEMTRDDLKEALRFEVDKYIPFGVDEVSMDFAILGKVAGQSGQMRVLLAAAKKDLISKRIEMLGEIGLNVTLIDINAFAVFNSFCYSSDEKP